MQVCQAYQLTGNGQLALTLQERSIGDDELLRLITKDPISKYSVVRSLATPSRLLLDPSKILFFYIFSCISTIPHSFTAMYMSPVPRLRQQLGVSQLKPLWLCGADHKHHSIGGVDDISFCLLLFFFGGQVARSSRRSFVGGEIL